MTGLENRLSFDQLLKDIENEEAAEKDWAMLMIDLNGLKNTNDMYGHEAGDTLIVGTSKVIQQAYGEKGHCFRIGGDEFVVIIDATQDELEAFRNKLKDCIETYNSSASYQLSMAIGEARLNTTEGIRKSVSDWKMQADLDMYREKDLFHKISRRK